MWIKYSKHFKHISLFPKFNQLTGVLTNCIHIIVGGGGWGGSICPLTGHLWFCANRDHASTARNDTVYINGCDSIPLQWMTWSLGILQGAKRNKIITSWICEERCLGEHKSSQLINASNRDYYSINFDVCTTLILTVATISSGKVVSIDENQKSGDGGEKRRWVLESAGSNSRNRQCRRAINAVEVLLLLLILYSFCTHLLLSSKWHATPQTVRG